MILAGLFQYAVARRVHPRRSFRPLLALLSVLVVLACPANAAPWEYWLERGSKKIIKCPGDTAGRLIKLANPGGQWVEMTGVLTCKDQGTSYLYHLNFLKVRINPARRSDVERDPLRFDWVGVEVYKPNPQQERINWMFGEAKPVDGTLAPRSQASIAFGNVFFVIPKDVVDQATNFSFFLTAEGLPFVFGQL